MTEEKVLTRHPLCKSGRNIGKARCETIGRQIVAALRGKELTHTELFNQLNKSLKGKFPDNMSWYGQTIKLELEARTVLERTSLKLQRHRLR
jgi:hypothetical protein